MRVAVIGAGFSGMLAAYLLEKEGLDVTIYEKQEHIGGHCRTIVSKDVYIELGTLFSFSNHIKELLIQLQVDYSELFLYRNYIDENYNTVEFMPENEVALLVEELERLDVILSKHEAYLNDVKFGYIPKELMMSFNDFINTHNFKYIHQIIRPFLSSFGFGNLENTQAYYVFKAFDRRTLDSFIQGEKSLYLNKGTSDLINNLSLNISDIRYSLEVINIETVGEQVKVETSYGFDHYDKVLITTKLPTNVIKDTLYNQLMAKIETNPFITCAYEVTNKNLTTTYFTANMGKPGKLQFFYTSKQKNRTTLIAYAYGHVKKEIIQGITHDLKTMGIDIKQLITVKQWYIFPHLKQENLTQDFYKNIHERQNESHIGLIGSLVTEPSLDKLYVSVKHSVGDIIDYYRSK